jgi:hypothetical protein
MKKLSTAARPIYCPRKTARPGLAFEDKHLRVHEKPRRWSQIRKRNYRTSACLVHSIHFKTRDCNALAWLREIAQGRLSSHGSRYSSHRSSPFHEKELLCGIDGAFVEFSCTGMGGFVGYQASKTILMIFPSFSIIFTFSKCPAFVTIWSANPASFM